MEKTTEKVLTQKEQEKLLEERIRKRFYSLVNLLAVPKGIVYVVVDDEKCKKEKLATFMKNRAEEIGQSPPGYLLSLLEADKKGYVDLKHLIKDREKLKKARRKKLKKAGSS